MGTGEIMEALPPQDLGTVHETEQKVRDDELSPLSVRQVAELATTSSSSNSNCSSSNEAQVDEREKLMRAPPRRGVSRHKSSSGGGPGAASGNFRKKPQLLRAQSMRVQLPPKSSSGAEPHRGALSRASSSAAASRGARHGPVRTNSRKPLQRAISQGSESGGLRPYRGREQVVNQSIQRMDSSAQSIGDMSAFTMGTMDSVSLRKAQIVADPLDDQTYNDHASFADHDSISMMSDFPDYTEFLPGQLSASSHNPRRLPRREDSMSGTSFCTLDSVQLRQKQTNADAEYCDASFSTIESRDLCFEANKEFDEYSCLDEYSSRELLDNVEVLKEENEYDYEDSGDDDEDELLDLGNVVIDDSDDEGELLEEDEDDEEEEK